MAATSMPTAPVDWRPSSVAPSAPEPAPRRRGFVRAVVLVLVCAVMLDITCRIEDWVTYRTPFLSRYTSQSELTVRDRDGAHGRPNARFQKWVMNSLGMRGPEASAAKPPGTIRVVTVGASETFGLSESPGREFPRQLEDSLNAALRRRGGGESSCFEVLNAAMPGMTLPTATQDVQNRVSRLSPDVIVAYPSPVGYLDVNAPRAARPNTTGRVAEPSIVHALRPRFLDRLRSQLKALTPGILATWLRGREIAAAARAHPSGWKFTSVPSDRLAQYDADLRRLVGTVRSVGAIPVLATHANVFVRPGEGSAEDLIGWQKFLPRATAPTILAFDSAGREVTRRVAADSGVALVDLAGRLATTASNQKLFSDFTHFTDLGAGVVAGGLAPVVTAEAIARRSNPTGQPARQLPSAPCLVP